MAQVTYDAQITLDDFAKVDIRVGRVVHVEDFPKARKPAYKLRIDFGDLGVKASSAQITKHYGRDDLKGAVGARSRGRRADPTGPCGATGQQDCVRRGVTAPRHPLRSGRRCIRREF